MILGLDQSKRSTGVTAINRNGELLDFTLITPPLTIDNEELINYQWEKIDKFVINLMRGCSTYFQIDAVAMEGLAFGAKSASIDLLWAIQWYIRTRFLIEYNINVGIITAATWRSTIVPIKEQRQAKLNYGGKIGLKHAVEDNLPQDVHDRFAEYLIKEKDRINAVRVANWKPGCKSNEYRKAIWDLGDSWGIAQHRLSLFPKETSKLIRRKD